MRTSIAILTTAILTCLMVSPVALATEHSDNATSSQPRTTVVFWTNETSQGPIRVYVNREYVGTITTRYESTPRCGAPGCVTVVLNGSDNTWYGVASDGTRWFGGNCRLHHGCNPICLHHAGISDESSPLPPQAPRRHHPRGDSMRAGAPERLEEFDRGWEDMIGSCMDRRHPGVPYLGFEVGGSVFYGEFARLLFAAGGPVGAYLYGGVGRDLLFCRPNSDSVLWHGGVGMRFSFDRNHYNVGLVYGETPLCYNQAMLVEFVWRHYFGDLFGVFAGAGGGVGDFRSKEPKFVWDVQLGISIKLWQH